MACGMTGGLAGLTGVVSYLYGDYGMNPNPDPTLTLTLTLTR